MQVEAAMQVLTKRYPKNCLRTVMDQYSATVHNMEQVVMFPSLLRDMQPHAHEHQAQAGAPSLYNYFTMLKAICVDMDQGLQPWEEWQVRMAGYKGNEAVETEEDKEALGQLNLEAQFHLHLSRLHHILTHLTLKAKEVTRIYQEITGQAM
ncbi:thyroid hormone-inducible hepatic protein [Molossus nigricans]